MTHHNTLLSAMLVALAMTGCHSPCGGMIPIWTDEHCAEYPMPIDDTALPECDIMLELTANGESDATAGFDAAIDLAVNIENVSGIPQTFVVIDRCPDGLVVFDGLGEGFDYEGTCLAGDCLTYGESVEHTLAPEASLLVETAVVPWGDDCNAPIAPGVYTISGSLPLTDDPQPMVCGLPARLSLVE